MSAGALQEDGGGDATPAPLSETGSWIHRTALGVSVGSVVPGHKPDPAPLAFFRALRQGWQVRRTLWLLVQRDFKVRYRAQALGLLWSFANPLVMMAILSIVFVKVMKVPVPHFPVFLLIGQLLWQFLNNSVTAGTASLIDNTQIVKRTVYPRQLVPIAAVLSHLLNFVMECLMLVAFVVVFPDAYRLSPWLLFLPIIVGIQVVFLFGVTMATSALNVVYRDIFYLVTSVLLVLFWLTPVVYSTDMVPPWLQTILAANPLTGVITSAREIIMHGRAPNPRLLGTAAAAALAVFLAGAAVFRKYDRVVSDYL